MLADLSFSHWLSLHLRFGILTEDLWLETTFLHYFRFYLLEAELLTLLIELIAVLEAAGVRDGSALDHAFLTHLANHLLGHF